MPMVLAIQRKITLNSPPDGSKEFGVKLSSVRNWVLVGEKSILQVREAPI